jgi:hypothetical protein
MEIPQPGETLLGKYRVERVLGASMCYRSLSTKLSTPFSIKQFDGNAISLGKAPLRSVTSSFLMEFIQISSSWRFV